MRKTKSEYNKKYFSTEEGRKKMQEAQKRYYEKNKEKIRAKYYKKKYNNII